MLPLLKKNGSRAYEVFHQPSAFARFALVGHLCALCLGWASLRTFFALLIVAHFTLDIVVHFALGRCALYLGSLSPFARSLVSIHVLVANWCGRVVFIPRTQSQCTKGP
jgi:hypothetical protein